MNEYQLQLFNQLYNLATDPANEAFYGSMFELNGGYYYIFNYRLASYNDFLQPAALEARGIMFEVDYSSDDDTISPIRLACLPPPKFFNLHENPFTMNIDFDRAVTVEDKADGSLISSYLDHDGEVRLKTKGSLYSEQAYQAEEFLFRNGLVNWNLADDVIELSRAGYTVNMEWCSPENRIVLGYTEPSLKVFSIRSLEDGSYLDRDQAAEPFQFRAVYDNWVYRYQLDDIQQFITNLPEMKDIEGVVVTLDDDQKVKIKTNWYMARHHTKDSINTPRRLFEAVLEEATDDMKSMFWTDPVAIKQIEEMERFVEHKYNHMVEQVENFYEENKDLDRKSYAIKGKEQLDKLHFGLAMKRYEGRQVDYKNFLKGQWKKLGLKDEKADFE